MEVVWARPIVAVMLIACSGAVYYFVAAGLCPLEWKDIVNIIVGALVASLTTVVQYYSAPVREALRRMPLLQKC